MDYGVGTKLSHTHYYYVLILIFRLYIRYYGRPGLGSRDATPEGGMLRHSFDRRMRRGPHSTAKSLHAVRAVPSV